MASNSAPPPKDEIPPTLKELHEKSRSLVSLLELTSAINHCGHPTLPSSDPREYDSYIHEGLLDATASLLVRHEEVVAVAVSGPKVVALQEQETAVNTGEPDVVRAEVVDPAAGPHYPGPLTLPPSSDPRLNYQLPVPIQAPETEVTAGQPDATDKEVTTGELDAAEAQGPGNPADDEIDFEETLYGDVGVTKIAAIVNPYPEYRRRWGFNFPDGKQVKLIEGGKSHLPKIRLSPDGLCTHLLKKIKPHDPLQNHIRTVEDYFARHRKLLDVNDRATHENYFALYLVVQCWRKMFQRIVDWSSQGYISELGEVLVDKLEPDTIYALHRNRHNHDLARIVLSMADKGQISSLIMERCGRSEWRSERFTNLLSTFTQLKLRAPQHHEMYNRNTCVEFHRLLVATLLAYGQALSTLRDNKEKASFMRVWQCGGLLREIASSLMLRQHLKTCAKWLSIPINETKYLEKYYDYTGFPETGCKNPVDDPGLGNDPEMDLDGSEPTDIVFLKWIRLQVNHWLALGTLSRTVGFPSDRDELVLSLVAVNYPALPRRVEPWRDTVKNLISRNLNPTRSYSASDVINFIEAYIARPIEDYQHPVFKKWRNGYTFTATIHCEAALASLAKYANDVSTQHHMQDHADVLACLQVGFTAVIMKFISLTEEQNIDQNTIRVSKLCCPACWETLDSMHGPNDRFGVSGRHPTVYAVELPPWLPHKVMMDIVGRFEQNLNTQILTMMMDRKKRHIRRSSGQSASAASTGSHGLPEPADLECDTFASNNNPDGYESSVDSNEAD